MRFLQHYRSLDRNGRRYWWIVGGGVILFVGLILWLRAIEHPWEGKTPKRVARGDRLGVEDYVHLHLFWAGTWVAVILGVLIASSKWWWRWANVAPPAASESGLRPGRISLAGILIILVIGLFMRAPAMDRLVLRDEQDNLRRSIHGFHELDKHTDEPSFRANSWQDAFFENRFANNPILFSLASKASLSIWRGVTGAEPERFSPVALRMPTLLCGLASIAGTWWLLLMFRLPAAGLLAALYLALHPLHIEYSIQARGYGIMMLGVVMAAIFAIHSLRGGRWRAWIGFALGLFISLYSYAGSIYFVVALGTCVGLVLLSRAKRKSRVGAAAQVLRLALVGIVAGTTYYFLISPSLPQIDYHLTNKYEKMPLSPRWLFHSVTQYGAGTIYHTGWRAEDGFSVGAIVELIQTKLLPRDAMLLVLVLAVTPLLALLGIWRLAKMGSVGRVIIFAPILALVLDYSHHQFITHLYAYYWYWIYSLPFLAAAIAIGLLEPERLLRKWRSRDDAATSGKPVLTISLAAVFFAFFMWQTAPGKPGRTVHVGSKKANYSVFRRGSSNWVVYADGKMLRQLVEEEIAEGFPW